MVWGVSRLIAGRSCFCHQNLFMTNVIAWQWTLSAQGCYQDDVDGVRQALEPGVLESNEEATGYFTHQFARSREITRSLVPVKQLVL